MTISSLALTAFLIFLVAAGLVYLGIFVPVMSIVAGIAAFATAIALVIGK